MNRMDNNDKKLDTEKIAQALGGKVVAKVSSVGEALHIYRERMHKFNKEHQNNEEHQKWVWPIKDRKPLFPDYPGTFGAVRKFDVHSGVDLYCEIGDKIVAVEDGVVGKVAPFTGKQTDTPWWNDTEAILVHGKSGVVVYGEVKALVKPDDEVKAGQVIAEIEIPVLTEFKGRPTCMLHLELLDYEKIGDKDWLDHDWKLDHDKPEELLNPTDKLIESAGEEIEYFDLKKYDGQSYTLHAPTTNLFFEAEIVVIDIINGPVSERSVFFSHESEEFKSLEFFTRIVREQEINPSYSHAYYLRDQTYLGIKEKLKRALYEIKEKWKYKIVSYKICNVLIDSDRDDCFGVFCD